MQILDKYLLREINVKYHKKDRKEFNISCSKDAYTFLKEIIDSDTLFREEFYLLCLSKKNNIIGWYKLSSGGIDKCIVDIRILCSLALNCLATSIIIAHNHPSDNLQYSFSDEKINDRVKKACEVLDICLLDSLILTSNNYYSFADNQFI